MGWQPLYRSWAKPKSETVLLLHLSTPLHPLKLPKIKLTFYPLTTLLAWRLETPFSLLCLLVCATHDY